MKNVFPDRRTKKGGNIENKYNCDISICIDFLKN